MSGHHSGFRSRDLTAGLKAANAAGLIDEAELEEFLAGKLKPVEFRAIRRPGSADNTNSQG
jgi:hypothetical protein